MERLPVKLIFIVVLGAYVVFALNFCSEPDQADPSQQQPITEHNPWLTPGVIAIAVAGAATAWYFAARQRG